MKSKLDIKVIETNLQEIYSNHTLPSRDWHNYSDYDNSFNLRQAIIQNFGIFGLPTKDSSAQIAEYIGDKPAFDLCAGSGYLSYCLSRSGVKIKAFDNYSSSYGMAGFLNAHKKWFEVQELDSTEIVSNIKNSVLIICWPDLHSDFAYRIALNADKSNKLLYIGERQGGCTADDGFFQSFKIKYLDSDWYSFLGIHDDVYEVEL